MSARFRVNALAIAKIYLAIIYANAPRELPATPTFKMVVQNQKQVTSSVPEKQHCSIILLKFDHIYYIKRYTYLFIK